MIQIEDILKSGEPVYIQAVGRSMRPTFRDRVDYIGIEPCDTSSLQVGDVVFFNRGDQYCLHRIISRDGDTLVIRGDGNSHGALEKACLKDVLGKVAYGTMKGGKPFKITDKAWTDNTEFVLRHHRFLAWWHRLSDIARRYPFSIVVSAAVVYLSFMKQDGIVPDYADFDKYAHFAMYFATSFIFWIEYLRSHVEKSGNFFWKGLLFCFLFPVLLGGLLELGQTYLTEYRCGEWKDFFSNLQGALTSTVLSLCLIAPLIRKIKDVRVRQVLRTKESGGKSLDAVVNKKTDEWR